MSFLDKVEKRIETSIGSVFARLSKAELQPVEISQAVRSTMDQAAAALDKDRVLVPHLYKVLVAPTDFPRVTPGILSAVQLEVAKYAAKQGYRLASNLELQVVPDPQVPRGQVKVGYAVLNRTVNWTPALIIDGRRISLKTGVTTVGRDESADIAIDDRGLSRIHFEIAWNGEVAAIRDRQSTNGTFLDDARISEVVLRSGNVIKAGRSEFEFELSANAQVDA
ncbi:MAG: DUF3662 and FHA domain-containing protein [Actinomycetota bacterium]|nr:DUF3662 and FHA domain-containing protein [Actinomycetota bacterium]